MITEPEAEAHAALLTAQGTRKAQLDAHTAKLFLAGETPNTSVSTGDTVTGTDLETGAQFSIPTSSLGSGGAPPQLIVSVDYSTQTPIAVSGTNWFPTISDDATVIAAPDVSYGFDEYTEDMGVVLTGPGVLEIIANGAAMGTEAEVFDRTNSSLTLFTYSGNSGGSANQSFVIGSVFGDSDSLEFGGTGRFYIDTEWGVEEGEPTSTHNVMFGFRLSVPNRGVVDVGTLWVTMYVFWWPL